MIYIGIDPGLDGSLVAIDGNAHVLAVHDTPVQRVAKSGKGTKRVYLPTEMLNIVESILSGNIVDDIRVMIEQVASRPGQGVTSMFSMGHGYGLWIGIISALRIPLAYVAPQTWKSAMGIPPKSDKSASIVYAQRLFPSAPLTRKKDDGRADALLIAEYNRRFYLNGTQYRVNAGKKLTNPKRPVSKRDLNG